MPTQPPERRTPGGLYARRGHRRSLGIYCAVQRRVRTKRFSKLFSELHAALNLHYTDSSARKNDGMHQRGGELNKLVRAGGDLAMLGTPWREASLANGQTNSDIFFQGQCNKRCAYEHLTVTSIADIRRYGARSRCFYGYI
jgi:hypothetical protein